MKKRKPFQWGENARRLMLSVLPIMIFLAFLLTLYVARLDGVSFLQQKETVWLALETLSRLLFCLGLGTVAMDYAEKKTEKNT